MRSGKWSVAGLLLAIMAVYLCCASSGSMKFLIPGNYSDSKTIFEKLHFSKEYRFHDVPFDAAMLSLSEWASSPVNVKAMDGQSAEWFTDVDFMVMRFSISEAELDAMAGTMKMERIPDESFRESVYEEMMRSLRPTTPWFDTWEAEWDAGKIVAWGAGWNNHPSRSFNLVFVGADAGMGRLRVFLRFHSGPQRIAGWRNGYFRRSTVAKPAGSE